MMTNQDVVCGDIRQIPLQCEADLVLTDPPYGIGKKDYDNTVRVEDLLKPLVALVKPGGHLLIDSSKERFPPWISVLEACGIVFRMPIIYYCTNGMGRRSLAGWSQYELTLWFSKQRIDGKLPPVTRRYRDIIAMPLDNHKGQVTWRYPNPKNVNYYRTLIRMFCPEQGMVIDPMCGSGTALVAAALEKRSAIGVEIEPQWAQLTQERLRAFA
jgi:DNA modification methylase